MTMMHPSIIASALVLLLASVAPGVNAGTQKTLNPTPLPVTDEPTPSPITPAPTPCVNRLFYIITIDGTATCSNGINEFTDSPDFFANAVECCSELAGSGDGDSMMGESPGEGEGEAMCKVVDICNPTDEPTGSPTCVPATPAPTPCEGRGFNIITDIEGVTKCSNGMENIDDSMESVDTVEECCAKLVADGILDADEACKYIDICNPTDEPTASPVTSAPTPCEDRTWYSVAPTTTTSAGSFSGTKCTNGFLTGNDITVMFDTLDECCAETFEDVTNCKVIDVCNPTEEPTPVPTPMPVTPAPVEVVITPEPTMLSTPGPTLSPPAPTLMPTTASSMGSTPTVGKEVDSGYVNLGPRVR